MSYDIRFAEGGITAISACLPDSCKNPSDVTATLFELGNELNGNTEPSVVEVDTYAILDDDGEVDIEDYRNFYVRLDQQSATPSDLEAIIRTIGRHAGEGSIGNLHAFLPRNIGNVALNLLAPKIPSTGELKSLLKDRVEVTLAVIEEDINQVTEKPIVRVNLEEISFGNSLNEGDVQFSVGIFPDTSTDQLVQAMKTTLDHVQQVKTLY